ncbi:MAG: hypothetical protein Q8K75_02730 [Chlamydiales bacterium]|nr:hypothetical protein [Chlamydiales bacterium]
MDNINKYKNIDSNHQWKVGNEGVEVSAKRGRLGKIADRLTGNTSISKVYSYMKQDIAKVEPGTIAEAHELVSLRDNVLKHSSDYYTKTGTVARFLGGNGDVKRNAQELSDAVDAKLIKLFMGIEVNPAEIDDQDRQVAKLLYEGLTDTHAPKQKIEELVRFVESSGITKTSNNTFWQKFSDLGFPVAQYALAISLESRANKNPEMVKLINQRDRLQMDLNSLEAQKDEKITDVDVGRNLIHQAAEKKKEVELVRAEIVKLENKLGPETRELKKQAHEAYGQAANNGVIEAMVFMEKAHRTGQTLGILKDPVEAHRLAKQLAPHNNKFEIQVAIEALSGRGIPINLQEAQEAAERLLAQPDLTHMVKTQAEALRRVCEVLSRPARSVNEQETLAFQQAVKRLWPMPEDYRPVLFNLHENGHILASCVMAGMVEAQLAEQKNIPPDQIEEAKAGVIDIYTRAADEGVALAKKRLFQINYNGEYGRSLSDDQLLADANRAKDVYPGAAFYSELQNLLRGADDPANMLNAVKLTAQTVVESESPASPISSTAIAALSLVAGLEEINPTQRQLEAFENVIEHMIPEGEREGFIIRYATAGYPGAQYYLANKQENNDPVYAIELYTRAAKRDHLPSMAKLAQLYREGSPSINPSPPEAHYWTAKLSATDTTAMLQTATDLTTGYGTLIDLVSARHAFQAVFENENSLPANREHAARMFIGLAENALRESFGPSRDIENQLALMEEKSHLHKAQFILGHMYEKGQLVPQDIAKAHQLHEVSGAAQARLESAREFEQLRNYQRAFDDYCKAWQMGSADAWYPAARISESGLIPDRTEAIKLYTSAAIPQGDTRLLLALGRMQNEPIKAAAYFLQAANASSGLERLTALGEYLQLIDSGKLVSKANDRRMIEVLREDVSEAAKTFPYDLAAHLALAQTPVEKLDLLRTVVLMTPLVDGQNPLLGRALADISGSIYGAVEAQGVQDEFFYDVTSNPIVQHLATKANAEHEIATFLNPETRFEWMVDNRHELIENSLVNTNDAIFLRLEGFNKRQAAFDTFVKSNPKFIRAGEARDEAFSRWLEDHTADSNIDAILPKKYLGTGSYAVDPDDLAEVSAKVQRIYRFQSIMGPNDAKLVEAGVGINQSMVLDETELFLDPAGLEKMIAHFDHICEAEKASSGEEPVLFHCQRGKSRSAASMVAVLVAQMNLTVEDAEKVVMDGRPVIGISTNLRAALHFWAKSRLENQDIDNNRLHFISHRAEEAVKTNRPDNLRYLVKGLVEGEENLTADPQLVGRLLDTIRTSPLRNGYLEALNINANQLQLVIDGLNNAPDSEFIKKWSATL